MPVSEKQIFKVEIVNKEKSEQGDRKRQNNPKFRGERIKRIQVNYQS